MLEGGVHSKVRKPAKLRRVTGVKVRNDRIVVRHPFGTVACPGVPEDTSDEDPELGSGEESSAEGSGEVPRQAVRRSLRDTARSLGHLLTHKPAMSVHCEACMRAKARNLRKYAGRSTRDPKEFGDLVTVDHVVMRDLYGRPGIGGYPDAFLALDVATGWKACYPVDTKEAMETFRTLQSFKGNDSIWHVYSDNHRSIRKACELLGVMWEGSQPGVRQTNARIERCNQDVIAGGAGVTRPSWSAGHVLAICGSGVLPRG